MGEIRWKDKKKSKELLNKAGTSWRLAESYYGKMKAARSRQDYPSVDFYNNKSNYYYNDAEYNWRQHDYLIKPPKVKRSKKKKFW